MPINPSRPVEASYPYPKLDADSTPQAEFKDFKTCIRTYIQDYCDGEPRRFNRTALAEVLQQDRDTITKIISGRQRTQKRDVILVTCLDLERSVAETNQALELYSKEATNPDGRMKPLDPSDPRDRVFISALTDKRTVEDLIAMLKATGCPPLDTTRDGKKDKKAVSSGTCYEELSVEIIPYCVAGDDSDRSLHDRYRPDRYDYHAEMDVRKKEGDCRTYQIVIDDYSNYSVYVKTGSKKKKCLYSTDPIDQDCYIIEPCTDSALLAKVTRLQELIDRKARYIKATCADTRNYVSRYEAVNQNGQLLIYGESFGYEAPELCEYFQLEVSSHECKFTVSDTSLFLERYIGSNAWRKMYGVKLPPVKETFTSLKSIRNRRWRIRFQKMLKAAKRLLDQLRERKVFLTNARAWLEIDDLITLYKAEEAFDCKQPEDLPYTIIPQKDSFIGPDGNPITIDDLYRAAELDIFTIEDLCTIRTRYGSLDNFLTIDALTAQEGKQNE